MGRVHDGREAVDVSVIVDSYRRIATEDIAEAVARRLVALGAVVELRQLAGLSAQEFDLLAERER